MPCRLSASPRSRLHSPHPLILPTTLTAAELKLEADLGQTVLSTSKPGSVFLRLNLKSLATAKSERRTPVNVAIVIDRSGSMQGDRIAAAKEGARVALKRLSSDDIVSLVSYNHDFDVLSPAAPLRDSRDKLIEAIDNLRGVGHHRASTPASRKAAGRSRSSSPTTTSTASSCCRTASPTSGRRRPANWPSSAASSLPRASRSAPSASASTTTRT